MFEIIFSFQGSFLAGSRYLHSLQRENPKLSVCVSLLIKNNFI